MARRRVVLWPAPRAFEFGFDGLILSILAVGATYGARTIFRLRRQVAEARQLGQYRLRRLIGSGGMGGGLPGRAPASEAPLRREVDPAGTVTDPRALERFEREVRLTARLSHPNTVEIYDYGRTEDGTYYYVMEYLQGPEPGRAGRSATARYRPGGWCTCCGRSAGRCARRTRRA